MNSSNKYNFVILDLTIPGGMGGKETMLALQKLDPKIKAFASSGYSTDPVMSDHERFGFIDKITKPFTSTIVKEVFSKAIGRFYPTT